MKRNFLFQGYLIYFNIVNLKVNDIPEDIRFLNIMVSNVKFPNCLQYSQKIQYRIALSQKAIIRIW